MRPEPISFLVVGAGGVGSHIIYPLVKTFPEARVSVMDGDKLEKKNLERQRFSDEFIGTNKSEALSAIYPWSKINPIPHYFAGSEDLSPYTHLLVCVDNHIARSRVLASCDRNNKECVIGANEYFDSQAYYYKPEWARGIADPRIRYPEIETDKSNNPINCTGESQESSPQLCLANFSCAGFMLRLLWTWIYKAPESKYPDNFPVELSGTLYSNTSKTMEILRKERDDNDSC